VGTEKGTKKELGNNRIAQKNRAISWGRFKTLMKRRTEQTRQKRKTMSLERKGKKETVLNGGRSSEKRGERGRSHPGGTTIQ